MLLAALATALHLFCWPLGCAYGSGHAFTTDAWPKGEAGEGARAHETNTPRVLTDQITFAHSKVCMKTNPVVDLKENQLEIALCFRRSIDVD